MILAAVMCCGFAGENDAFAIPEWFLFSRHGECAEIASLKRKVPDLGEVRDPDAFITLMRDKGHRVTVIETSVPNGRLVEVTVPDQGLAVAFVTAALCRSVETR
ncbi:MAG: hypothetical protein HP492_04910 [Nitrospira sp.]|nr:hypothetical protein [Nitrospira sp.]